MLFVQSPAGESGEERMKCDDERNQPAAMPVPIGQVTPVPPTPQ